MRSIKVLMVVAALLGMSGCVTQGMYTRGVADSYQRGFKDADAQCSQLQMRMKAAWDTMTQELADKNARLDEYRKGVAPKLEKKKSGQK